MLSGARARSHCSVTHDTDGRARRTMTRTFSLRPSEGDVLMLPRDGPQGPRWVEELGPQDSLSRQVRGDRKRSSAARLAGEASLG